MCDVSLFRLYLLRGVYLLIAVGMGVQIWPVLVTHAPNWELMHGVADCMLGALTAIALLGIPYPLRMLPLLFYEMAWKSIWLAKVALPLWLAHRMNADVADTAQACLVGVIVPIVIPWRYVWANYAKRPTDRWVGAAAVTWP